MELNKVKLRLKMITFFIPLKIGLIIEQRSIYNIMVLIKIVNKNY